MLLAGLGVGMIAYGLLRKVIKLKIENYLDSQSDTASAIGALTPTTRRELQEEARRLLSLEQKVLEMEQSGAFSDPNIA